MNNNEKALKKSRLSWYFYDFGNSAYASVILLAVYSAYFKNVVVGGAEGVMPPFVKTRFLA
ncbi:MAG: MFS transporter [Eubacteriaceae bacterium]|nr:MFS transporter [Eubacteriaceae bacterium]